MLSLLTVDGLPSCVSSFRSTDCGSGSYSGEPLNLGCGDVFSPKLDSGNVSFSGELLNTELDGDNGGDMSSSSLADGSGQLFPSSSE